MKHNPEDHFRLVHKIARRYSKGNRMEYDDIFQEGCIGLMRACKEYKEGDVPFGAFAGMHIQYAILYGLRTSNFIKTNTDVVWLASKIKKMNLTESPVAEIAKKLGEKERFVERALQHLKTDVLSLDYQYDSSDNKLTVMDTLRYETNYDDAIFTEQVLDMYKIPERDKRIVRLVLQGYTLVDATKMLGESVKAAGQRKLGIKQKYESRKYLIYS